MPIEVQKGSSEPIDRGPNSYDVAKRLSHVIWIDETPWLCEGGLLKPLALPHVPIEVDRQAVRAAMKKHNAQLAYWTSDWDTQPSSWWWVVCDQANYSVDIIESKNCRKEIRRSLRQCEVRLVEPDRFAHLSYPIHKKAMAAYGVRPRTFDAYQADIQQKASVPGHEFWGVFVDDAMAAFTTAHLSDQAAAIGYGKWDPDYDAVYPNRAKFFVLTKYYLDRGMKYVTNGHRTLWHPTTINDFLERMGYRKAYARVNIELSPLARTAYKVQVAKWGRWTGLPTLMPWRWGQLQGLNNLIELSQATGDDTSTAGAPEVITERVNR